MEAVMNTVTEKDNKTVVQHESPADDHRLRSERIAAQGVSLGRARPNT
jgi:hypothetical protein